MKIRSILPSFGILAMTVLMSCGSTEVVEETTYDNEALFEVIQTSLKTRNISLEEYSEMTANIHGTPDFFREFGDLTYSEFVGNNKNLSEKEIHDKLIELQGKMNITNSNKAN